MSIHDKSTIAIADIVGRKVLVPKINESTSLFKQFYGKPLAISKPRIDQQYKEPLVLSLYEALYLCRKKLVEIRLKDRVIDCEMLENYCKQVSYSFVIKYLVYEYLRDRGYVIRGGIKYGADFSVYTIGPGYEHAPYVVTVVSKNHMLRPTDIVAIGRVSHSVKKYSVLAIVDDDKGDIHYIVFKWIKI